jgi:hypothetical protein
MHREKILPSSRKPSLSVNKSWELVNVACIQFTIKSLPEGANNAMEQTHVCCEMIPEKHYLPRETRLVSNGHRHSAFRRPKQHRWISSKHILFLPAGLVGNPLNSNNL